MVILFFFILSISLVVGEQQSYERCEFCCDKVLAKLESLEQSLNTLMKANGIRNTNQPAHISAAELNRAASNGSQNPQVHIPGQPTYLVGSATTGSHVGECASNVEGTNAFNLRIPGEGCKPGNSTNQYKQLQGSANGNNYRGPQNYPSQLGSTNVNIQHSHLPYPNGTTNANTQTGDPTNKFGQPASSSVFPSAVNMSTPVTVNSHKHRSEPSGNYQPKQTRYPVGIEPTRAQLELGERYIYSSCHEVARRGKYLIRTTGGIPLMNMICDMVPLPNGRYEKGWIVVQNRFNGSESFYRSWDDYVAGFGNLDGEFWLGLDLISKLVNNGFQWELMFRLTSFQGETKYQRYRNLTIGDETDEYMLKQASNAGGDAGDSFSRHQRSMFTTYDRDNDNNKYNCAIKHEGGWWYHNQCATSNLNGIYIDTKNEKANFWKTMYPSGFGLKATKIMIRFLLNY